MISLRIWSIVLLIALVGCSKDNDLPTGENAGMTGTIYYENFEGFIKIDLATKVKTLLTTTGTYYNWHITADGSTLLEMANGRSAGKPDQIHFTIRNLATTEKIREFFYQPLNGGSIFQGADLSPDKSMICVFPSFEEGFVLINAQSGEVMAHLYDINGEQIPRNQSFSWLPDNSLLIKWKQHILKTKFPFDKIDIVATFDTEEFNALSPNPTGTKIAMAYQGHIAVINADGSDFYMATSGNERESSAVFSPDGRFLLVGTDFRTIGVPGSVPSSQSFMQIIPADGNTYAIDQNNPNVMPVIAQNENSAEPQKGLMAWIP